MNISQLHSFLMIVFMLKLINNCGVEGTANSPGPKILYQLERGYTGETENVLSIEMEDTEGYTFSLAGEGFSADVAIGENHPLQEKTVLTYDEEGRYSMTLSIFRPDGLEFIQERMSWEYSTETLWIQLWLLPNKRLLTKMSPWCSPVI